MKGFVTLNVRCEGELVGALQHGCSKRIGSRVCSKALLGHFVGGVRFGTGRVELQAIDFGLQIAGALLT